MAASKRKDWNELLGGSKASPPDADAPTEQAAPPATVLMHTIVGNPDNPRPEDDYSDADPDFRELKASMKEIGQLQPLAVVSRPVFEQAKPDAIAQAPTDVRKLVQDAEWVVVTGNRRLAAARQLGWTRIDIRVQDHLGDEEGRIDEAVIIENIHRKNLAPTKEAEYLAGMLKRHGSQEKVAERIGKSQMFVSQRLALLNLAPDVREMVDSGELKIKHARQIARSEDHEEQRALVVEVRAAAAEPKPPRAQQAPAVQNPVLNPPPEPDRFTAVKLEPSPAPQPVPPAPVQNPVLNGRPEVPAVAVLEAVPEPRPPAAGSEPDEAAPVPAGDLSSPVGGGQLPRLPYDDGQFLARHLIRKMPVEEFVTALRIMNRHAVEQGLDVLPEQTV